MNNANETLGTIIDGYIGRDAIHVAVISCQAGTDLYPGDPVAIIGGVALLSITNTLSPSVGIVDPFLPPDSTVQEGQWFWLLVHPRTITGLTHVWTHPAFDNKESSHTDKASSEAWLREFCTTHDCPGYEDVIAAAVGENIYKDTTVPTGYPPNYYKIHNDGEYLHFGGRDGHDDIPPEFWYHIEIVTGKKIPGDLRAKHFSCSC